MRILVLRLFGHLKMSVLLLIALRGPAVSVLNQPPGRKYNSRISLGSVIFQCFQQISKDG